MQLVFRHIRASFPTSYQLLFWLVMINAVQRTRATYCSHLSLQTFLHIKSTKFVTLFDLPQIWITIKQDSYTKANESGEEAQKETTRLIDIGLPQSKNKVNANGMFIAIKSKGDFFI